MSTARKTARKKDGTWQKGQSGNPSGNKRVSERQLLWDAIHKVEKDKKETVLEVFVKRAWEDNRVLVALVDRLIPKLTSQEVTTPGGRPLTALLDISPQLAEVIDAIVQGTSHK